MIRAETGRYPSIVGIKSRILNFIKHIEKQGLPKGGQVDCMEVVLCLSQKVAKNG